MLGLLAVVVLRTVAFGWAPLAPDDARYLFVGLSTFAGDGPVTPSGNLFLLRAPVFGLALASGSLLVGGDPVDGARLIGLGIAVLGLLGAIRIGWLLGGAGGALGTAVALLATPLVWRLLPTLRVDLTQTAGVIAVVLALWRPTSARWAVAGALLGLTILVKETVLPLALLPLVFAGLVPARRLVRLWAIYLAAAAARRSLVVDRRVGRRRGGLPDQRARHHRASGGRRRPAAGPRGPRPRDRRHRGLGHAPAPGATRIRRATAPRRRGGAPSGSGLRDAPGAQRPQLPRARGAVGDRRRCGGCGDRRRARGSRSLPAAGRVDGRSAGWRWSGSPS